LEGKKHNDRLEDNGMTPEGTGQVDLRKRVLFGTISNYAGQLVNFATLFFLTPFILHRLGVTAYGLWVLIGSVVAYGSLLDLGIWGAVIKYIAEFRAQGETDRAASLVATALRLYTLLGLVVVALSAVLAPVIPRIFNVEAGQRSTAAWLVVLMGLGVGISLPGLTPMSILRGLQRYDVVNLIFISTTLFSALASVAALLLGGGVIGVVLANISGTLVTLVLGSWSVRRIAPEIRFGWGGADRRLIRLVFSYSWPLFVRDVAGRLQTKTDEITIGVFLPVQFIAPYNLARRLSEVTHLLTRQFMRVLLPLASELHAENDRARLRLLYTAGTRLTLAISIVICCILILLARPILTLWVGEAYAGAGSLVAILALASFIATSQWPAGAVLQGMARHRVLAVTSLCSGVANLILSVALVRPFGLTGVALGTLIPNLIEFAILLPFAMKVIGVRPGEALKEIFLPALIPALLMVTVLYAMQRAVAPSSILSVGLISGTGTLAYIAGYLSLGANAVERQTFRGAAFGIFRFARTALKRLA
jgi:O-antigen/teichoic acid export membrane protein